MARKIDYFYSHVSPWSFLGHARLLDIAHRREALINFIPLTLSEIFPKTGGLPLAKRPPERRAYRMLELQRWSKHLGTALNLEPKHFPVDDRPSLYFALAAVETGADLATLSHAIMRACWQEDRDISDMDTLAAIADAAGLNGAEITVASQSEAIQAKGLANCDAALKAGVFGAPWYSFKGEGYWGQDRLPLLEEALADG